jgi:hypothetical protein
MPDSSQGMFILVLTMPGFLGYLAFSKIYRLRIDDSVEKVGYIVGLNIFSLSIVSLFYDFSEFLKSDFSNIGAKNVVYFVNQLMLATSICSVAIGTAIAVVLNGNWIQNFLNQNRVTPKTAHGSVLADIIANYPDAFFKVRFKSGGHVTGFPRKYPLDGEENMIFLTKALRRPSRVTQEQKQPPEYEINGPGILLVNFDDVSCIEVLKGE